MEDRTREGRVVEQPAGVIRSGRVYSLEMRPFVVHRVSVPIVSLERGADAGELGVVHINKMSKQPYALQVVHRLRGHLIVLVLHKGCVCLLVHDFDADDNAVVGEEREELITVHTGRREAVHDHYHLVILSADIEITHSPELWHSST